MYMIFIFFTVNIQVLLSFPRILLCLIHLHLLSLLWSSHCPSSCSDIWALGCVLYEMCTLKHAVSIYSHLLMTTH